MGSEQPNEADDIAEEYLRMVARDAQRIRATELNYARTMYERGTPPERIMEIYDIDRETLDRMLRADGRIIDPDCVQSKHRACIGQAWDDSRNTIVPCQCECHGGDG